MSSENQKIFAKGRRDGYLGKSFSAPQDEGYSLYESGYFVGEVERRKYFKKYGEYPND